MSDIWERKPHSYSPFYSYIYCLLLLLCWSLTENYVAFRVDYDRFQKVVSSLCTVTILALLVGFFSFWQFLRITAGEMAKDEFLFKINNFKAPEPMPRYSDVPTWQEFLMQERCDKGLAISTITDAERIKLRAELNAIYINTFNKKF